MYRQAHILQLFHSLTPGDKLSLVSLLPAMNFFRWCHGIDENPGGLITCVNDTSNNLSPVATAPVIINRPSEQPVSPKQVINTKLRFVNVLNDPNEILWGLGETDS